MEVALLDVALLRTVHKLDGWAVKEAHPSISFVDGIEEK
jgi:hypothetical protein